MSHVAHPLYKWKFNYRYGPSASNLTDDTLNTVGNVYNIAQNSKMFTPKGLLKRTVKDTGKSMVYSASMQNNVQEPPESDDSSSNSNCDKVEKKN